jgi:hypothetical protein
MPLSVEVSTAWLSAEFGQIKVWLRGHRNILIVKLSVSQLVSLDRRFRNQLLVAVHIEPLLNGKTERRIRQCL